MFRTKIVRVFHMHFAMYIQSWDNSVKYVTTVLFLKHRPNDPHHQNVDVQSIGELLLIHKKKCSGLSHYRGAIPSKRGLKLWQCFRKTSSLEVNLLQIPKMAWFSFSFLCSRRNRSFLLRFRRILKRSKSSKCFRKTNLYECNLNNTISVSFSVCQLIIRLLRTAKILLSDYLK